MMNKLLFVLRTESVEDVDSVEELILAQSQMKIIDNGFQDLKLDTPDWVLDKMTAINREITLRIDSQLRRRLKNAKARREALRPDVEKRKILDDEIAELEAKLG